MVMLSYFFVNVEVLLGKISTSVLNICFLFDIISLEKGQIPAFTKNPNPVINYDLIVLDCLPSNPCSIITELGGVVI